ncbi:MAG: hypothetical protein JNG89_17125, partial [Planctomycetaceae bacterium]|nr:hypothetical protein [Planctomycetaceae bacterium]
TIVPAAVAVFVVLSAWPAIRPTSLRLAWGWSLAASLAVAAGWLLTGVLHCVASPWSDMLWYGIAELLLCPLIAVLGARRPGVAVWNWFVLIPLLAVLGWPVAAAAMAGARPGSFILETPPLAGVLLVLVMGAGNYAGTRFRTSVAALLPAAVAIILFSLKSAAGLGLSTASMLAVWCVGAAAAAGWWSGRRPRRGTAGPDRVWQDFRDQFGIVWAQRIRERVNERAAQEKWRVRLERSGFVQVDGTPAGSGELSDPRISQALRWLLRRFVDIEWLDARLGVATDTSGPPRE